MRLFPSTFIQSCFTAILCLIISSSASAQGNSIILPSVQYLLDDWKTVKYYNPSEPKSSKVDTESRVKRAQRISKGYTGYAIELTKTDMPLLSTDAVFKKNGNICYDRNTDGTYSYLIVTAFSNKKNIKLFIDTVLKSSFPDAKMVKYKQGKR